MTCRPRPVWCQLLGFPQPHASNFAYLSRISPFQVTVSKVATFLSKSHEDSRWLKKGLAVGSFIKANITCFMIFSLGRVCMHFFDQHYYQNVRKNRPDLLVLECHTPLEYSSGFHWCFAYGSFGYRWVSSWPRSLRGGQARERLR
jgi:hypothetical protein